MGARAALMTTLAVIPARGGSKSIPRKNLADLAGRPLLYWTVQAARDAQALDRTVVSTEDAEILAAARQMEAEPLVRPGVLATDDVPSDAVVMHALDHCEADVVVLLHPTSPLRTAADIDACVGMVESGHRAAVSVYEPERHPRHYVRVLPDRRIRWASEAVDVPRQQMMPAYAVNGAIYAARVPYFRRHGFMGPGTVAYVMPRERSVDIDSPADLAVAEALMREAAA